MLAALIWGSASRRKGSGQGRERGHPDFLVHPFPGVKLPRNSFPQRWARVDSYTIEFDVTLLKELGAKSCEVNMGLLSLQTVKKSQLSA